MSKPIIALKTHARDYDGLVTLGTAVHEAMSGNVHFPAPPVSLPGLKNAIDLVSAAIGKWGPRGNRGSHADLVDLRLQAQSLLVFLQSEARYVASEAQQISGSDYVLMESIISSSAFPLRKRNSPQGVLEKVQNFHHVISRTLNSNEVMLQWEKPLNLNSPHNVKNYFVFKGTTPSFLDAVVIDNITVTSFIDVNDTDVEQTWYYWIAPFNYAGMGVVSEMMKVTVLWG